MVKKVMTFFSSRKNASNSVSKTSATQARYPIIDKKQLRKLGESFQNQGFAKKLAGFYEKK